MDQGHVISGLSQKMPKILHASQQPFSEELTSVTTSRLHCSKHRHIKAVDCGAKGPASAHALSALSNHRAFANRWVSRFRLGSRFRLREPPEAAAGAPMRSRRRTSGFGRYFSVSYTVASCAFHFASLRALHLARSWS